MKKQASKAPKICGEFRFKQGLWTFLLFIKEIARPAPFFSPGVAMNQLQCDQLMRGDYVTIPDSIEPTERLKRPGKRR
jgi:hypothetical protein